MFKKRVSEENNIHANSLERDPRKDTGNTKESFTSDETTAGRKVNNILKGSRVTGDINVTCDLILSGDVKGNIIAREDANIVIKGSCKGNIETRRGNVDIRGELQSGNITTEGNVSISGKFTGGEVKAGGKIYVNCDFTGRLEGSDIEIGSHAHIKGEIFYKEFITISRGARVEVHLCRLQEETKKETKSPEKKVADMKQPVQELIGVK